MKQFRNTMLGLGIVFPLFLLVAYLVWIKIDSSNDVIVLGTISSLCFIGILAAVTLGRNLRDKQLIWGGIFGYVILVVMVTLFVRKATAPIDWRKPVGVPAYNREMNPRANQGTVKTSVPVSEKTH